MLPKSSRLTVRDIDTLSEGKSVFGTLISVRFKPSSITKFSVSVSKKVAKEAVDRNRIRRRIYSVLEKEISKVQKPVFVMIMPKKECLTATSSNLSTEVATTLKKAGLIV